MVEKQMIALLILAAGSSSRMGKHIKQLLPWKNTTLLGNAIHEAQLTNVDAVYVVLGANSDVITSTIALEDVEIILNTNWQEGLGSSISVGIHHFFKHEKAFDGVMVLLADQPLISASHLKKLITTWKNDTSKIIATGYKDKSGVPAIFGKTYFAALQNLNKDFGAKDIIRQHKTNVLVQGSNGKHIDIDTWEEYQRVLKSI